MVLNESIIFLFDCSEHFAIMVVKTKRRDAGKQWDMQKAQDTAFSPDEQCLLWPLRLLIFSISSYHISDYLLVGQCVCVKVTSLRNLSMDFGCEKFQCSLFKHLRFLRSSK